MTDDRSYYMDTAAGFPSPSDEEKPQQHMAEHQTRLEQLTATVSQLIQVMCNAPPPAHTQVTAVCQELGYRPLERRRGSHTGLCGVRHGPPSIESPHFSWTDFRGLCAIFENLSKQGPQFVSRASTAFLRKLGVTLSLTSGYHLEFNGQAERSVQELPWAPARLLECVRQPPLCPWDGKPTKVPEVNDWYRRVEQVWEGAHTSISRAVVRFKP